MMHNITTIGEKLIDFPPTIKRTSNYIAVPCMSRIKDADDVITLGEFIFTVNYLNWKTDKIELWKSIKAVKDPTWQDALDAAQQFLNATNDIHHYLDDIEVVGPYIELNMGS